MSRSPLSLHKSPNGNRLPATARASSDRLAAIEEAVAAIQQTLDVQFERMAQMQAQIDVLAAKERDRDR